MNIMRKAWNMSAVSTVHILNIRTFGMQYSSSWWHHRKHPFVQARSAWIISKNVDMNHIFSRFSVGYTVNNVPKSTSSVARDRSRNAIYKNVSSKQTLKDRKNLLVPVVDQLLRKGECLKYDDWKKVFEDLRQLRIIGYLPAMLMTTLISIKNDAAYDLGQSLYHYIDKTDTSPNIALLSAFILLCTNHGHIQEALQSYDELCKVTKVFDSSTCAKLATAFSQIDDHWRKSLEFLVMAELTHIPTSQHYSPIIIAAMKHGDTTLAMDLMNKLYLTGFMPSDEVFVEAMNLDTQFVLDLLEKVRMYGWIVSENVVSRLSQWFSRGEEDVYFQKTQVSKRGQCKNCGIYLEDQWSVTPEQFHQLRESFLEKSLKRNGNIFINMLPEELDDFEKFLTKHEPFDMILDGLNISGKAVKSHGLRGKVQMLRKVTEHLHGKFKRILVLGRKHMNTWPVTDMNKIQNIADVYLANSMTEDDPLLLYAALRSGMNTHIVTSDQLRDHRFLLGPKLADVFKIWQRGHQVVFEGVWRNRDGTQNLMLKWPNKHEIRAQWTKDTWHIPFEDGVERASYNLPNSWFCINKTITTKKKQQKQHRKYISNESDVTK